MKPESLLRLYPRAWRERYGEEFLALIERTRVDWRMTMDVAKSASTEWLNHPNLRGGRELLRLILGFLAGVVGVLGVVAVVQASFMSALHLNNVLTEVAGTTRMLVRPLAGLWVMSMTASLLVTLCVIRFRLHRSRPKVAEYLTKYLAFVVFIGLLTLSAQPFARISPYSMAMVLEVALNVYLAGIIVHWAVFGGRVPEPRAAG